MTLYITLKNVGTPLKFFAPPQNFHSGSTPDLQLFLFTTTVGSLVYFAFEFYIWVVSGYIAR